MVHLPSKTEYNFFDSVVFALRYVISKVLTLKVGPCFFEVLCLLCVRVVSSSRLSWFRV